MGINAVIGALRVNLGMNSAQFERGSRRVSRRMRALGDQMKAFGATVKRVVLSVQGLLAGLVGAAFVGGIIRTNVEFQSLKATLETFVGSADKAGKVFEILQGFAARTPFSLQQVTQAFNRMLSVGLTPSIRALEAFGNVASGSSKSVLEFVEAVADASVGEFERLKEFGIKARKEGDQIVFTFKGMETKVANSAAAITEFLTELGETEFAGAIDRQSKILAGAISNAGDAIDSFRSKIGTGGFNDDLRDAILRFTEMINGADGLAEAIGRLLSGALSVLETAFRGIIRGAKLIADNWALVTRIFLTFLAANIAIGVVKVGIAVVKLAEAIRAAGLVLVIFKAIQSRTLVVMLTMAGVAATAVGAFDDYSEAMNRVVETAERLVDFAGGSLLTGLEKLGVNTKALTADFSDFFANAGTATQSVGELDAQLAAILGTANAAGGALDGLSTATETAGARIQNFGTRASQVFGNLLGEIKRFAREGKFELSNIAGNGSGLNFDQLASAAFGFFASPSNDGAKNIVGSLFGGNFAAGGVPPPGKISVVGENGPEPVVGNGRARVLPNSALGGNITVNLFNAPAQLESQTTRRAPDGSQILDLVFADRRFAEGVDARVESKFGAKERGRLR